MTSEISDFVSCAVSPYLIHFGEKGITPKVLHAKSDELLILKKVEGPRLGDVLKSGIEEARLKEIYEQLGSNVGYISKYCIEHGDLHTENIIIENGMPIIIDWGSASFFGIFFEEPEKRYQFWIERDSKHLLRSTRERLGEVGKMNIYPQLENTYSKSFKEEILSPRDVKIRDMERKLIELITRPKI